MAKSREPRLVYRSIFYAITDNKKPYSGIAKVLINYTLELSHYFTVDPDVAHPYMLVDDCKVYTCHNGGTCRNLGDGRFSYSCRSGYRGRNILPNR